MTRPSLPSVIVAVLILVAAALIAAPADAQTGKPKRGGILNSVLTEDPPGLLVHESATISNVWPMSPCYSNLVIFDPLKPLDSAETVIPELAEKWSWQDNYRNLPIYLDLASFVVDQLRLIGMEATLKQLDTAAWFPALSRRDFQIGANLTAGGFDDPDAYLFENYKCGSPRNYTDYCSEEIDRLIDQQSQELDRAKRLKLVADIQRKLEADVARPMLGWRKEYFARWPHVKNLVPHNALYNYGRMQEVWLDR